MKNKGIWLHPRLGVSGSKSNDYWMAIPLIIMTGFMILVAIIGRN